MGLLNRIKDHRNRSKNDASEGEDTAASPAPASALSPCDPGRPQGERTMSNASAQLPPSTPMTNGQANNSLSQPQSTQLANHNSSLNHTDSVDLTIQFIEAKNLPRTDPVGGGSDPYFKAVLDGQIAYNSTAQKGTMNPVWNEVWHVKNVPKSAELKVDVYDKDENILADDYIGSFQFNLSHSGSRELDIKGRLGRHHGTFLINIMANPVKGKSTVPPYTFAGPCRYSRHRSPTVGALTAQETDDRLYATWKVYLMGIHEFFGDSHQHWNEKYPAAQKIFGHNPLSKTIRGTIHGGHKLLYARSTANEFGIINRAGDLIELFKDEQAGNRIKPAVYTYIINDDTWRFSETGAAFFVDFASKHALHADRAQEVRYSGEFHWRPQVPGGWSGFSDNTNDDSVTWELLIDNNSGTYAPDKKMLPAIKSLFEYNFPGIKVSVHDHGDQELKDSEAALRTFAKERRGIKETEFTAHDKAGETTLINMANRMGLTFPKHKHDDDASSGGSGASQEGEQEWHQ